MRAAILIDTDANPAERINAHTSEDNAKLFDMQYDKWIECLWDALDESCKPQAIRSREWLDELQKMDSEKVFFSFQQFESTVRGIILPNNERSLSDLVLKTAWEGEYFDADGHPRKNHWKEALQRDSYYATMVRGASRVLCTPASCCLFLSLWMMLCLTEQEAASGSP